MSQGSYVTAAATTAGVLAGAYCAYHLYTETKKHKLPKEWKKVGTLESIFMYPIKSCAGIQKTKAECTVLGLKDGWLRDRILMVVDDKYNSVTGRAFPKLLLVYSTMNHSTITLKCKDMEPLHLDLEQIIATQSPKEATLWGVQQPVYECGWESNEWFSRYLNQSSTGYRLVLFRDRRNRILKFKKTNTGAFADEVPFNLINQASIDDLNTRLNGLEVNHRHFRTNFLLSGAQAYDEDNWKFVKIGENIFEIIKPCTRFWYYHFLNFVSYDTTLLEDTFLPSKGLPKMKCSLFICTLFSCNFLHGVRCIMTTNNPDTGVRNSNVEPLETLRSYRQETDPELRRFAGSSPRMGLQMVLRSGSGGIVSINDTIYVA